MALANEEANLIFEDRGRGSGSPGHNDESEDEDRQQELEEMLYSQVHYDDSVINTTSIEDKSLPVVNVNSRTPNPSSHGSKLGFPSSGRREYSQGLKLPTGCAPSQFNHPGRTKASRYYDVNQDEKNAEPVFIAPQIPGRKRNVQAKKIPLQSRSMVQSPNNAGSRFKFFSLPDIHPDAKSIGTKNRKDEKNLKDNSADVNQDSCSAQLDSTDAVKTLASDASKKGQAVASSSSTSLLQSVSSESDSGNTTPKRTITDNKTANKCNQEQSPSPSRKSKQHSFEAKVSKVLSSMLDDESRSSLEETQSAPVCATQDLNTESGWSVGMSWADMSSKFSFGVDSIEEESVSSLQLHDSTPAESRTSTPDLQAMHEVTENEEEEESRYQMQLKPKQDEKDNKQNSKSESDSESEVGSVVEVAPPGKASPPLVDISDGEYVPMSEQKKVKAKTPKDDIVVLFSKQRNSTFRGRKDSDYFVESSSDDDVVILDEPTLSFPRTGTVHKVPTKRSCTEEDTKDKIPRKRTSHGQDKSNEITTINQKMEVTNIVQDCVLSNEEEQLLEKGKALLSEPLAEVSHHKEIEKLDRWLYDPIKSTKALGHEKMFRKMSGNPDLWKICQADKGHGRMSPGGPKCTNCNHFGHRPKFCPEPKKDIICHMCGNPGHSETRCIMKMCLRCGRKSGLFTDRCNSCLSNTVPCKICESRDHEWKLCPDLWRRYHLTTSAGEIVEHVGEEKRPKREHWCSNCAGNGHLSHECRRAQWKCQSISPYIKSYAAAADEEIRLEKPNQMSMLLTDSGAALLSSPVGKTFLQSLSKDCNVPILTNFDSYFKTLVIEGVNVKLDEVRERVRIWIQQEEKKSLEDHLKEEASVILDPWELPNSLSKNLGQIADTVGRQLRILDSPKLCDMTVREIYESLKGADTPKKKRQYCRMLNMILLGKCGFDEGHQHVKHLKTLLGRLRVRKGGKGGTTQVLLKRAVKHFLPVFSGQSRTDYESLVEKFYSNASLVEKFDNQQKDSEGTAQPNTVAVESNDSSQDSKPDCELPSTPNAVSDVEVQNVHEDLKDTPNLIATSKKMNMTLQAKVKKFVPIIMQNLSARFIFCKDLDALHKEYSNFHNQRKTKPAKQKQCFDKIMLLCERLCKTYNIKINF